MRPGTSPAAVCNSVPEVFLLPASAQRFGMLRPGGPHNRTAAIQQWKECQGTIRQETLPGGFPVAVFGRHVRNHGSLTVGEFGDWELKPLANRRIAAIGRDQHVGRHRLTVPGGDPDGARGRFPRTRSSYRMPP